MRKLLFLVSISLCLSKQVYSQDTIRIIQYNLLNFGLHTSYCTNSNNSLNDKISGLKTVINFSRPDILAANEIGRDSANYQIILDSILKPFNPLFESGKYSNCSNADLTNMLFYNGKKLKRQSQTSIATKYRDIILYRFYYNSDALLSGDTIFLNCFQAHLKAGNTTTDESERADETALIMNYIQNHNLGANILLLGDFNLYTSSETAYQNLVNNTNSSIRFYDPIYKSGSWSNNENFAAYHTQSTRLTGNSCYAEGGLNDRFDFILCSYPILSGTSKIAYIPGSYKTIGQDGNHYNKSVNYGINTATPDSVSNALYDISDHLPVSLSLKIDAHIAAIQEHNPSKYHIYQTENTLIISRNEDKSMGINVELLNLLGQRIFSSQNHQSNTICIPIANHSSGIYLLKITDETNNSVIQKIQLR